MQIALRLCMSSSSESASAEILQLLPVPLPCVASGQSSHATHVSASSSCKHTSTRALCCWAAYLAAGTRLVPTAHARSRRICMQPVLGRAQACRAATLRRELAAPNPTAFLDRGLAAKSSQGGVRGALVGGFEKVYQQVLDATRWLFCARDASICPICVWTEFVARCPHARQGKAQAAGCDLQGAVRIMNQLAKALEWPCLKQQQPRTARTAL